MPMNDSPDTFLRRLWGRFKRPRVMLALVPVILLSLAVLPLRWDVRVDVFHHFVVFDITQSMNVKDMRLSGDRVSRLAFAKHQVREALPALPCGSTVSVGVFTGHRSFVLFKPVEICQHFNDISDAIAEIDWRMAWEARSEVSKGIFSAIKVAPQLDDTPMSILFLTDGHEAPPLSDQYRPRYKGDGPVLGNLLGIGDDLPVPIPMYGFTGKFMGYWSADQVLQVDTYSLGRPTGGNEQMVGVDQQDLNARIAAGTEHLSSLKADHLQALAGETGMHYTRPVLADDFREALTDPALASSEIKRRSPAPWLAASALLLVLGMLLVPWWRSIGHSRRATH